MVKLGETNNRGVVAFSDNIRFYNAKVNYIDSVRSRFPNIQMVNTQAVKTRLLNAGVNS
jgi:hypothetical protein